MTWRYFPYLTAAVLGAPCVWSQNLPGMASGILNETALARKAVAARDKADATDHIRKAEILTGEIQKQSPRVAGPIMVPVRKEIEITTTYTPVKRGSGEMSSSRLKKKSPIRHVERDATVSNLNVAAVSE